MTIPSGPQPPVSPSHASTDAAGSVVSSTSTSTSASSPSLPQSQDAQVSRAAQSSIANLEHEATTPLTGDRIEAVKPSWLVSLLQRVISAFKSIFKCFSATQSPSLPATSPAAVTPKPLETKNSAETHPVGLPIPESLSPQSVDEILERPRHEMTGALSELDKLIEKYKDRDAEFAGVLRQHRQALAPIQSASTSKARLQPPISSNAPLWFKPASQQEADFGFLVEQKMQADIQPEKEIQVLEKLAAIKKQVIGTLFIKKNLPLLMQSYLEFKVLEKHLNHDQKLKTAAVTPSLGELQRIFRIRLSCYKSLFHAFVEKNDEEGKSARLICKAYIKEFSAFATPARVFSQDFTSASIAPLPSMPEVRTGGLPNLGNTCYLNASLQALSACAPVMARLNQPLIQAKQTISKEDHAKNRVQTASTLSKYFEAMAQELSPEIVAERKEAFNAAMKETDPSKIDNLTQFLFHIIENKQTSEVAKGRNAAKVSTASALARSQIRDSASLFEREPIRQLLAEIISLKNQKKDVREHLETLLQLMFTAKHITFDFAGLENRYRQQDASAFIQTVLGAVLDWNLASTVERKEAVPNGYVGIHQDSLAALIPISLGEEGDADGAETISLQDLIDQRFSSRLNHDEWKVNNRSITSFTEKSQLQNDLGGALAIQLQRYVQDSSGRVHKKDDDIYLPMNERIDFSVAYGEPAGTRLYQLKSFVVHDGGGVHSGHYRGYTKENGEWFHCDDSSKTKADPLNLARNKAQAYVMIFERV